MDKGDLIIWAMVIAILCTVLGYAGGYSDAQKNIRNDFLDIEDSVFNNITNADILIRAEIYDNHHMIKLIIENSTTRSWVNFTIIKEPLGIGMIESYWITSDGFNWREVTGEEMKEYLDKGNGE